MSNISHISISLLLRTCVDKILSKDRRQTDGQTNRRTISVCGWYKQIYTCMSFIAHYALCFFTSYIYRILCSWKVSPDNQQKTFHSCLGIHFLWTLPGNVLKNKQLNKYIATFDWITYMKLFYKSPSLLNLVPTTKWNISHKTNLKQHYWWMANKVNHFMHL